MEAEEREAAAAREAAEAATREATEAGGVARARAEAAAAEVAEARAQAAQVWAYTCHTSSLPTFFRVFLALSPLPVII